MTKGLINEHSTIDSIRRIVVVIVGIILALIYAASFARVFNVNNRKLLNIETIAILSWCVKIVLLVVEEFLLNDEIFEFIIITLETAIIGFIFYKLVKTIVQLTPSLMSKLKQIIIILRIFYIFIALLLVTNLIMGILSKDYFNCSTNKYNYHWYVTLGINTLLWYLNLINGIVVFRKREYVNLHEEEFNVSINDLNRVKNQMNILIYGYATTSTLTTLWFILFSTLIKKNELICKEHPNYWEPSDEAAGAYAFLKTILLIAPTIVIWL